MRAGRLDPATIVFTVGMLLWVAAGIVLLISAPPLGHDESQYAIAFRGLLNDGPERWVYLSKGMHAIVAPGYALGGGDVAMRLVPFLFGIAFVLAAAQLANRFFGPMTAAWTVVVLATALPVVRFSIDLLSDVPAAACLLAGTSVLLGELTRAEGARWRVCATAPLFAAAFYIRYASCVPIAIVGLVALAVGWRNVRAQIAPALMTAGLFFVLLLPHALAAIMAYGSPFAILLESQSVPHTEVSGLETYLTSNPFRYFGLVLAPVAIAGALSLRPASNRITLALWIIGAGHVVGIGLSALGQARYVFFGLAVLVLLGVEAIRRLVAAASPQVQRVAFATSAISCMVVAGLTLKNLANQGARRERSSRPTVEMADALERDAAGHGCHFLANHYPQIEWYSGCDGHDFDLHKALARRDRVYYVGDDTTGWQPSASDLAMPHDVVFSRGKLYVIRIRGPKD